MPRRTVVCAVQPALAGGGADITVGYVVGVSAQLVLERYAWSDMFDENHIKKIYAQTFFISDVSTKEAKPARACNACYDTVFPLLTSPSTPPTLAIQPQGEAHNSYTSTLGTLSQLPSWKSMPSFAPPGQSDAGSGSSSALLKPPPSAFHRPRHLRTDPRPQSQPVMNLNLSRMTSAAASSVSIPLNSPPDNGLGSSATSAASPAAGHSRDERRDESRQSLEPFPPDGNKFSVAALAVHTAPVTARPSSVGEGRSKRFSLLLGGRSMMQKIQRRQTDQGREDLDHGIAASKLSEILGREKGQRV